jgi:hypothetical protein
MSCFWPLKVPGSPGCWLSLRMRQGRVNRAFVSGVSGVSIIEDKEVKKRKKFGTSKRQGLVRALPSLLGQVGQMQQRGEFKVRPRWRKRTAHPRQKSPGLSRYRLERFIRSDRYALSFGS